MKIDSFMQMYLAELQELASVQDQLEKAAPELARRAAHPALKDILANHREENEAQRRRLATILEGHAASPSAHHDQAMEALLAETGKMLDLLEGDDLRDAGLIASSQKIALYQVAAFGTAAALAGQLGLVDEQQVLHRCCEEHRTADERLSRLAKREINPEAAAA